MMMSMTKKICTASHWPWSESDDSVSESEVKGLAESNQKRSPDDSSNDTLEDDDDQGSKELETASAFAENPAPSKRSKLVDLIALRLEDLKSKIKIFEDDRFHVCHAVVEGKPGWKCLHCGVCYKHANATKALAHLAGYKDENISVGGCNSKQHTPTQVELCRGLLEIRLKKPRTDCGGRHAQEELVLEQHKLNFAAAMTKPGKRQTALKNHRPPLAPSEV